MINSISTSIIDIEKSIILHDWQRNLGNKRTKAGKYYWLFFLIYFQYYKRNQQPVQIEILTKSYWDIFYKPEEFFLWLLDHFNGVRRTDLAEGDFNLLLKLFRAKFGKNHFQIIDKAHDWLKQNPIDFSSPSPNNLTTYQLDFLDHRHPHLPTVSESFKSILDAANYSYNQNSTLIGYSGLKRSEVYDFNEIMDELIITEYMYHFVSYLSDFCQTSFDTFHSKIPVSGPTEALQKAIELEPEILNWPEPRLKYQIGLKYASHDSTGLNPDSVQSAIRNFKTQKM